MYLQIPYDELTAEQKLIADQRLAELNAKLAADEQDRKKKAEELREKRRAHYKETYEVNGRYIAPLGRVLKEFGHDEPWDRAAVYIVRDGDEILYVGCSTLGARTRLKKHWSGAKKSGLGYHILANWHAAQSFTVECLFKPSTGNFLENMDTDYLWEWEDQKIKECDGRFNIRHAKDEAARRRERKASILAIKEAQEKLQAADEAWRIEYDDYMISRKRRSRLIRHMIDSRPPRSAIEPAVLKARELGIVAQPATKEQSTEQWAAIRAIVEAALYPGGLPVDRTFEDMIPPSRRSKSDMSLTPPTTTYEEEREAA